MSYGGTSKTVEFMPNTVKTIMGDAFSSNMLTHIDIPATVTEEDCNLYAKWNKLPVITSTAPTTASKGVEYVYTTNATDEEGNNLTYSLSNAPEGMAISDSKITWTPEENITSSGEVLLTVNDGFGSATETFTIAVSIPTSIKGIEETNVPVYPNPTSSVLNIKNDEVIESVDLISISGIIVFSLKVNNTKSALNIEKLDKGLYFVKVNSASGSYIKRIIKK